ncbi:hypothetical protein AWV79_09125 [Cupriavidus sp. UYMMa02A]|nr:hypothetical protein AWV79_09125 [Cupriavidus sp. UYMMa02A]
MSIHTSYPAQLPAGDPPAASVTGCALFRQLEALADAQPDSVAVGCATYRDLVDASLALAGYMQQRLGVRAGDHVLLMLDGGESSAIATYAIARCGAQAVALDVSGDGRGDRAADGGAWRAGSDRAARGIAGVGAAARRRIAVRLHRARRRPVRAAGRPRLRGRRSGRYRAGAIASRSPVRLFRRCLVRFSS